MQAPNPNRSSPQESPLAARQSLLFSWDDVDQLPDLERLDRVLEALPDEALIAALEARRGRGRNDYPVRALWRVVVAMVVLQHPSIAALVRELRRNPALLQRCGFDPLGRQSRPRCRRRDGVPSAIHVSRFLRAVSEVEAEQGLVTALAASLRSDLVALLPGFGEYLGYDGKALPAHATGRSCPATGAPADPDADWRRHETPGKPDTIGFG